MKRNRLIYLLLLLLGIALQAAASPDGATVLGASASRVDSTELPLYRPVTSSYCLEMGSAHLADTYLTPLHYRGDHFAISYERDQAMRFDPQNWIMQLKLSAAIDNTKNPAKNATLLNASFDAGWYMMRRWSLSDGFTVGVGGGASLDLGVLYLRRNSNNPASAKCSLTLDATGYLSWSGKIGRLPVTLRYQPTMPVFGGFFSPDYGELYYQIYLGKTEGLSHTAWPGNFFRFDNLLTADLHFGSTSLRIGYHGQAFSSKVNNIVTQNFSNAIVIGITTEWISLKPTDRSIEGRIISSY